MMDSQAIEANHLVFNKTSGVIMYNAQSEKTDNMYHPLIAATLSGEYSDVYELLKDKKTDIDVTDDKGWPPLSFAIGLGRTNIFHLLMSHGASIKVIDKEGASILMIAARSKNVEYISRVLALGPDIDHQDSLGRTALFYASDASYDATEKLIMAGADLTIANKKGETALHNAIRNNMTGIAELLFFHQLKSLNSSNASVFIQRFRHAVTSKNITEFIATFLKSTGDLLEKMAIAKGITGEISSFGIYIHQFADKNDKVNLIKSTHRLIEELEKSTLYQQLIEQKSRTVQQSYLVSYHTSQPATADSVFVQIQKLEKRIADLETEVSRLKSDHNNNLNPSKI
jgi:hypothetical protein